MPKCIVDYCRNYAGMRKNYANVILHGFPTTVERIKLWLRAIEQSGQVFDNLDHMAEKIREGKKYDSYRVCSEHFTIQCYFVNGDKKILKKESIPTVFANRHAGVPCVQKHLSKRKEQLHSLAKRHLKKKATESLKENKETPKPKKDGKKKTKNWKNGQELAQKILNLTLEIIDLLTGEDYIVVKKSCPQVKLDRRTQCSKMVPQSRMLDWVNEHKILELTNRMVGLLTGEEQNCRSHKEAFTDVRMENPPSFPSAGVSQETDATPHPWFSSSSSMDVETVIVQDVQESKCFKISTWTAISEANGTKKLVLQEDNVVPDAAPNDLQILSVQIVEEPLLSENPKVYTQQMPTEEEAVPHRAEPQPRTDLYTHFECSPCEGITLPPNYAQHNAEYVDKEPITSKGPNLMDTTEQSGPKQNSSTCVLEESHHCLPPLDRKPFQYRSVIKDEPLSPSDTFILKKEPNDCEEAHFSQTQIRAAVCIKEEESMSPSTLHTSSSNIHYSMSSKLEMS